MKKKLLITVLAVVATVCCALGLAGCNTGGGNENNHKHNYEGYICTICGEIDPNAPYTEGLQYDLNLNETSYTVSKGDATINKLLKIPSTYKNVPVTSIGDFAFGLCTSLERIVIPDSVTSIGNQAFSACTGLTSLTIPDSVTSIGDSAFERCSSLARITIGNGITDIGADAFCYCTSLTSITVTTGNTKYHSAENCLIETEAKKLITGCKNSVIPTDGSVISIGDEAFYGCSSLTSITIPASITSIGGFAFTDCSSLTSVYITDLAAWCGISFSRFGNSNPLDYANNFYINNKRVTELVIPNGVTSIGYRAFNYFSSLKSISIPDSVTSIGNQAFCGCSSLESVIFENTVGWQANETNILSSELASPTTAAEYLTSTYCNYYWHRS